MSLAAVVAVLRAITDVAEGPFSRLNSALHLAEEQPDALRDPVIRTEIFSGLPSTRGAGASAHLSARRFDGGLMVWIVEAWIDDRQGDGHWSAQVKGELKVDDLFGQARTVTSREVSAVGDVEGVVAAVHACASHVIAEDPETLAREPSDLGACGAPIIRIAFDHGLVVTTEDAAELRIEGAFLLRQAHGVLRIDPGEGRPAVPGRWDDPPDGEFLMTAAADRHGMLSVGFNTGWRLRVPPDEQFEAWTFTGASGEKVVCMPGGELAIWRAP